MVQESAIPGSKLVEAMYEEGLRLAKLTVDPCGELVGEIEERILGKRNEWRAGCEKVARSSERIDSHLERRRAEIEERRTKHRVSAGQPACLEEVVDVTDSEARYGRW